MGGENFQKESVASWLRILRLLLFFLVVEFDGEGGDTFLEVVGLFGTKKNSTTTTTSLTVCVCVLRLNNTHYS